MVWRWGSESLTCHLTRSAKAVKLLWWLRLIATVINFKALTTRSPHNSSAAARPQRAVWLVIQRHVNLAGNQARLFKSPPSSRLPTVHLLSGDGIQTPAANCCSPASRLFSAPRRRRVCHRSLPANGLFMRQARGRTDWFFHYLLIHPFIVTDGCLLSIHILCWELTARRGVEKPSVNLTRRLSTCFRVVPRRPWAEVALRSATLADNKDGQRKKSGTIVPFWMVCEQKVSPERVSGLPQRAENTLSYFLLLLWYFKLWNLIAKPADGLLNCPCCPPSPPSLSPSTPLCFHSW